jgi:hypothetical protein
MEQDVARLASAVDAVRAVRPDHARLPFFISQLEQERAIQGTAGQPVRAVDSMGRPIEAPAATGELPSVRVQAFVQLANERMRSNQLVGKDGALGYVLSARRIDPSDPGVVAAAGALGNEFAGNVQKAIRENQLDDANRWYQNAVELGVERPRLAALRADIDAARIGNERADRARLLVLANQRIAQGRLLEPKGDSAQHYVDLLGASAPDLDGLADARGGSHGRRRQQPRPRGRARARRRSRGRTRGRRRRREREDHVAAGRARHSRAGGARRAAGERIAPDRVHGAGLPRARA